MSSIKQIISKVCNFEFILTYALACIAKHALALQCGTDFMVSILGNFWTTSFVKIQDKYGPWDDVLNDLHAMQSIYHIQHLHCPNGVMDGIVKRKDE